MNLLKLKKPRMHGPGVKRLQEYCDLLGYDYGPNDGWYGPDTKRVVEDVQKHFSLKVDGVCGPVTWAAILRAVEKMAERSEGLDSPDLDVYDRREWHPRARLYARPREWCEIFGVTIHQTGCDMAQHPRGWDRLNAHMGITREGKLIWVNPFEHMIWHAQRLSLGTIGLEIEGNFEGIDGNSKTLWTPGGGPHHLNPDMLDALERAFLLIRSEFENHERKWMYIQAHRQSSKTRTADPGEEIWKKVAMPWIERLELDKEKLSKFSVGYGKPIPKQWDSDMSSGYWS